MEDMFTDKFYALANRLRRLLNHYQNTNVLTRQEYILMHIIHKFSENTQKANTAVLSDTLMVSKSAVSQMINNLEERGYLERSMDKSDRRKSSVILTDSGENVLLGTSENLYKKFSFVFKKLGRDKTTNFLLLFEELLTICESAESQQPN